jgi:hypothetical protein
MVARLLLPADVMLSRMEGLAKSVALLKNVAPAEPSDCALQEF